MQAVEIESQRGVTSWIESPLGDRANEPSQNEENTVFEISPSSNSPKIIPVARKTYTLIKETSSISETKETPVQVSESIKDMQSSDNLEKETLQENNT